MVDPKLSQELLGVSSNVIRSPIRCQFLWDTEALEALTKQGDEIVGPALVIEDLEPVAERRQKLWL